MDTQQIAVRLPNELLKAIDGMVARGRFPSRAAALRAGAAAMAAEEERRLIDEAIVRGYQRIPPTADEDDGAAESLRQAILEEPW